jgi:NAD(P)-dependent dehydrogenase (short-subunit alcohol dehydrogenase family)
MSKVILITGATGGIGSALAQKLAQDGTALVLAARHGEALETLTAQCYELGSKDVLALPTDVTDRRQVEKLFEQTHQHFGKVDVVINGAGLGILKAVNQLSEQDFDKMLAVNLKGTFLVCQQAVTAWMNHKQAGHIFNIPGILGQYPMATAAGYCASKYGVVGFTKAISGMGTPAGGRVDRDTLGSPPRPGQGRGLPSAVTGAAGLANTRCSQIGGFPCKDLAAECKRRTCLWARAFLPIKKAAHSWRWCNV